MNRTQTILLAECDRHDEELIVLALESADIDAGVVVVRDGEAIVDFFLRLQKPRSRWQPSQFDLMLLELTLPKLDGLKVLRQLHWLFRDDLSKLPPIVVMAACHDPTVVSQAYRHGANGFLCKTANGPRFVESVQQTLRYWLTTTLRPAIADDKPPGHAFAFSGR